MMMQLRGDATDKGSRLYSFKLDKIIAVSMCDKPQIYNGTIQAWPVEVWLDGDPGNFSVIYTDKDKAIKIYNELTSKLGAL